MDRKSTWEFVDRTWTDSILPSLQEFIRIPSKSPGFDAQWKKNGHIDTAAALIEGWCREQPIPGMSVETVRLEGRTPVIFIDIPGASKDCVLMYGHLDKQPEMAGWREGLGPWEPVVEGNRLYGRGGADDGYAAYASLAAIMAADAQKARRARCVVLVEACEESGSFDLPHYIEALSDRIGSPSLIICLDSGCGNYEQLWCTTSLRGLVAGSLHVEVLSEGVHSGDASGIVASSFRILRQLLSRIENDMTGEVLVPELHVEIPGQRREQAENAAKILGRDVYAKFPFVKGMKPVSDDLQQLILNRTWRPALAITGASGLPAIQDAGNVLRPLTAAKISMRVPPTCDPVAAAKRLKEVLEKDPPYGAKVRFEPEHSASGWNAPELTSWLGESLDRASTDFFGAPPAYMGEGGTIPFMAMLGGKYPAAEFLITGVLGPQSNAHGPNEFLDIPTGKKLTCCVARVLADHFRR